MWRLDCWKFIPGPFSDVIITSAMLTLPEYYLLLEVLVAILSQRCRLLKALTIFQSENCPMFHISLFLLPSVVVCLT